MDPWPRRPAVTPPAAGRPPALRMEWHDLCFLHWAVPAQALQRTLPRGVQLDTRAGEAYLGVVPFRMEGVAPLHVPDVPGLSAFPELNLRTYVTVNGEPGVWFYSLDVTQPLAAALARTFFHLPYRHSRMWVDRQGGVTRYASELLAPGTPGGGRFAGAYRPTGEPLTVPADSLEAWLTDRLNLFSADRAGRVYRGRIEHRAWPLRRALAQVRVNTLADPLGLTLTGEPHALHAERLDVRAHWLERVR